MHFLWVPIPWSWCFDVYSELCQLSVFFVIASEPFISAFTFYAHLQSEEDSDCFCIVLSFLYSCSNSLIGSQKAMKLAFMSPFTYFFGDFLSFKEMRWTVFATVLPCKWGGPFCNVYGLNSLAMKIMYSFLASVSWRPGSADFKVGTRPSEQMGINVSIGYKCYRHDSQFQMLQNVVLNFYLWM